MSRVVPGNIVYLDDYIDFDDVFIPLFESDAGASMNTFAHIYVDKGDVETAYKKLKGMHPKMKVYKREDIPENWHLNNADRTGDIFVSVEPGWLVFGRDLKSRYENPAKGMHGYDRFHKEMQASFFASGPNFKNGVIAKPIENVEVYGIIARILGLTPAKTDGNIENVEYFMQP
jgi:predicted AlkP superfamily pyrophosphatase or phosphodiesterase